MNRNEEIMYKNKINLLLIPLAGLLMIFSAVTSSADIDRSKYGKNDDEFQERLVTGVFDQQKNTVSNFEFYTTNYGIFGFDVRNRVGGGLWPRGSRNQYFFAGGLWFGATKKQYDTSQIRRRYVTITYNPNSGRSWMVPGRINAEGPNGPDAIDQYEYDPTLISKYRTYFSTDFVPGSGAVIGGGSYENWPIWDSSDDPTDTLQYDRYFGYYVEDEGKRNKTTYPKGPAFISGEDIFSTYKDTQLDRYEGGPAARAEQGYPLKLQYEQMIYSWGFGDYKDFIFLKYEITNYSQDTLYDCWLAPVMDVDIALQPQTQFGAGNDRANFYEWDSTLNLAYQWSNPDRGERGQGFGYLGFDFLESPAAYHFYDTTYVHEDNDPTKPIIDTVITEVPPADMTEEQLAKYKFVRKDKKVYTNEEQLGLVTFRNWSIENDVQEDDNRYVFMSEGVIEGETGAGDKRFMMATGPFHVRPADTIRVVVGIVLAAPAVKDEPDGSIDDLAELVRKDKFMQTVYDNNFQAPRPPDRSVITEAIGHNNAVTIKWDNTSVLSEDVYERGLDFMGYSIFRARRTDLDAYDPNSTERTGPFGWKQIAQYQLPTPFWKSGRRAGRGNDETQPFIDSLRIIGPYVDQSGNVLDTMSFYVMRIPRGLRITDFDNQVIGNNPVALNGYIPNIYSPIFDEDTAAYFAYLPDLTLFIDTSFVSKPWGPYWWDLWQSSQNNNPQNDRVFRPNINNKLWDAMVGVAEINPSVQKYNPMFYRKRTVEISPQRYEEIFEEFPDGVVEIRDTIYQTDENGDIVYDDDGEPIVEDVLTYINEVYIKDSYKQANFNGADTWVIDRLSKNKTTATLMRDKGWVEELHNYMYKFIKEGKIDNISFSDLQSDSTVKHDIMIPYMENLTNNNTYYDLGDDNGDAVITSRDDPTETERLINNMDYYYKVLAFDEGDYLQPTEPKMNDASEGLPNLEKVYPTAAEASERVNFEVISVDSSKIGGLRNFEFFSIDLDRTLQLFGGETLELEFQPYWSYNNILFAGSETGVPITLYQTWVTLRKQSTGELLYRNNILYEVVPCNYSYIGLFTQDAQSYVLVPNNEFIIDEQTGDTITFNQPDSREIRHREGDFFTGDFTDPGFCNVYGFRPGGQVLPGYGSIGFSFDYYISQYGGQFRADKTTNEIAKDGGIAAVTPVSATDFIAESGPIAYDPNLGYATAAFMDGSFNNGPGEYEVEFLPGGTESFEIVYRDGSQETITADYLEVNVHNKLSKNIIMPDGREDVVDYPEELPHMTIPDTEGFTLGDINIPPRSFPHPYNIAVNNQTKYPINNNTDYELATNDFIGKYNLSAYGFHDVRGARSFEIPRKRVNSPDKLEDVSVSNVGTQGRYYLSTTNSDGENIDFTHAINIGGVYFALDYANTGKMMEDGYDFDRVPTEDYVYGDDFKAGDKITLKTFGGAFGLPMPGAKVLVKISDKTPPEELTDDLMDQVKVVPNPYYISHQGVKSPYDNKLYFTKLPEVCTIDIYTVNGELIISLEHDKYSGEEKDRHGVQVWDLMSKNKQRVQSQGFIAVITTPDGAQTVKKFSVVVGGFNLNDEGL